MPINTSRDNNDNLKRPYSAPKIPEILKKALKCLKYPKHRAHTINLDPNGLTDLRPHSEDITEIDSTMYEDSDDIVFIGEGNNDEDKKDILFIGSSDCSISEESLMNDSEFDSIFDDFVLSNSLGTISDDIFCDDQECSESIECESLGTIIDEFDHMGIDSYSGPFDSNNWDWREIEQTNDNHITNARNNYNNNHLPRNGYFSHRRNLMYQQNDVVRLLRTMNDSLRNVDMNLFAQSSIIGMSLDEIELLKSYPYVRNNKERETCSICMLNFVKKTNVVELKCKHIFHYNCCKPWLQYSRQCPLCRMPN